MRRACDRGLKDLRLRPQQEGHRLVRVQEELGLRAATPALRVSAAARESIPQNNPANPKYRAFIALWRRLPVGLATRLGPAIVRNLG
jgi:hypothetical protein